MTDLTMLGFLTCLFLLGILKTLLLCPRKAIGYSKQCYVGHYSRSFEDSSAVNDKDFETQLTSSQGSF